MATMEQYIKQLEAERKCILFNSAITEPVHSQVQNKNYQVLWIATSIFSMLLCMSVDEFCNSHYMSTRQCIDIVKRTIVLIILVR